MVYCRYTNTRYTKILKIVKLWRLMQSRAWVARLSGARGARCAPLTAPVGVLVEIALHVQHQGSTSSSIWLSLLLFLLSLCVSVSRRFSSPPALCFRLCRRFLSAFRLCRLSCVLPRLCLCYALVSALDSVRLSHLYFGYASRSWEELAFKFWWGL